MQMALPHVNPDGKLCPIATCMASLHAKSGKCTIPLLVEISLEKNLKCEIGNQIGQEPLDFMEISQ